MKLTSANYAVPAGTMTISAFRTREAVLVEINETRVATFTATELNEETMATWHKIASVFQQAHGHRGTNSDVRGVTEELQRFV